MDKTKEQNVFDVIQKFVCQVYNVCGILHVDAARLQFFVKKYTVNVEEFNKKN